MKKKICMLLWLTTTLVNAQPTVTNAGNFSIGDVLKFKTCSATGVYAGSGGANRTWNFSSLSPLPDTLITSIVSPSSTTSGSLFATATVAERNSDETTNYLVISQGKTFLAGYVDTGSNAITIRYINTAQIQQNPITFGTSVTDTFSTTYTLSTSVPVHGHGIAHIEGDGYGTLVLPNGTYNNVLRVKLTQMETDSILVGSSVFNVTTISYIYFDGTHNSSLMAIDSTNAGGTVLKSVKYLLEETHGGTSTGIPVQRRALILNCYPNPVHSQLTIACHETGRLYVRDACGQLLQSIFFPGGERTISLESLLPGTYFLELETETARYRNKLLIN